MPGTSRGETHLAVIGQSANRICTGMPGGASRESWTVPFCARDHLTEMGPVGLVMRPWAAVVAVNCGVISMAVQPGLAGRIPRMVAKKS